jgi:hypothetical protein
VGFKNNKTEIEASTSVSSFLKITNDLLLPESGNSELLELRLLETGFLSRFQLNP